MINWIVAALKNTKTTKNSELVTSQEEKVSDLKFLSYLYSL